jgi:hypothetical protein
MSTTTAQGSGSTNNNVGRVVTFGSVSLPTFSGVESNATEERNFTPTRTSNSGVKNALQAAAATATNVENEGGKAKFTDTSHGLSVGDVLEFSGATAASYNTIHVVTAVPTANAFVTDIDYVASATPGDYSKQTGDFAKTTADRYVSPFLTKGFLAGLANTALTNGSSNIPGGDINRSITNRRYDETSWDYVDGTVTKGSNAGDEFTYIASKGSGTVGEESLGAQVKEPSFSYTTGAPNPVTQDYETL